MDDYSENERYERDMALLIERVTKRAKELGLSVDEYLKLQDEYDHIVCDGWYMDRTQEQWIEEYVQNQKKKLDN